MHAPQKTWRHAYLRLGWISRFIPGIRNAREEPSDDVYEERLLPFRPRFETAFFFLVWCVPAAMLLGSTLVRSGFGFFVGILFSYAFPPFVQLLLHRNDWVLRLGDDGFCVRRLGREGFVPWSEFEGFHKTKRGLVAKTRHGLVRLGRSAPVDRSATLKRINAKAAELNVERAAPRVLPLLDGHAEEHWSELLARAVDGELRTKGTTQTHLVEDLLNPRTSPALREALAKALQVRVDPARLKEASGFVSMRSQRVVRTLLVRWLDAK